MSGRTRWWFIAAVLVLAAGLWGAGFALGRSGRISSSAAKPVERSARKSAFDDAYRAAFPRGQLQGYPQGRIAGEAQGRARGSRQALLRMQLKLERRRLGLARRQARGLRGEPAATARRRTTHPRERATRRRHARHRHAARAPRPARCQTRLFGEGGEGAEAEGESEACAPTVRERPPSEGVGRTP